jgi:hypothetical protein
MWGEVLERSKMDLVLLGWICHHGSPERRFTEDQRGVPPRCTSGEIIKGDQTIGRQTLRSRLWRIAARASALSRALQIWSWRNAGLRRVSASQIKEVLANETYDPADARSYARSKGFISLSFVVPSAMGQTWSRISPSPTPASPYRNMSSSTSCSCSSATSAQTPQRSGRRPRLADRCASPRRRRCCIARRRAARAPSYEERSAWNAAARTPPASSSDSRRAVASASRW